ncbi:MAG TPA: YggS family pyridoxal phosphate-dependent enzyme [Bdellovibrionota bacterium]|nr:YggS family pyridoxal phosphate-dependent enzyme [Bdellovibrionota bacterium]
MSEPSIGDRWRSVLGRVEADCDRAKRERTSVRVVAVTKGVAVERIAEAYRAGARIFGENYVQELLPKMAALPGLIEGGQADWHFIGSLQSNKAKMIVGKVALVHSVDRWSLAQALDKASNKSAGLSPKILVEVNIASETTKGGIPPSELRSFVERLSHETTLETQGLMVFPPFSDDPERSRAYFAQTRKLAEEIEAMKLLRVKMRELSMGVTNDFEVAIEEGATLVRIGTAIFGPRS